MLVSFKLVFFFFWYIFYKIEFIIVSDQLFKFVAYLIQRKLKYIKIKIKIIKIYKYLKAIQKYFFYINNKEYEKMLIQ